MKINNLISNIAVIAIFPNEHFVAIIEKIYNYTANYSFQYFFFEKLPDYRQNLGWKERPGYRYIKNNILHRIAALQRILKHKTIIQLGFVAPFPWMVVIFTLACLRRRRIIVISEGLKFNSNHRQSWPTRAYFRLIDRIISSDRLSIYCIGHSVAEDFIDLGVRHCRFRKFCFAEDYSIFSPRHKHTRIENSTSTLSVGSLIKRKNFIQVIDALSDLKTDKNVKYFIAGEGPELNVLTSAARMLPKNIQVNFLGLRVAGELAQLFNDATFFVLSSLYDGWAVVVNQALHFHLPIVVSQNVRSGKENLVMHGGNGFIYSTPDELKTYLELLINNDELIHSMSQKSRPIAKLWNIDNVAKRMSLVLSSDTVDFEDGPLAIIHKT